MIRRRGFTLLEMLLAVVLSAMLMAAVLVVLGGVARDRRLIRSAASNAGGHDAVLRQLRWDLLNARTMSAGEDGSRLTLIGSGAIDRRTLAPTNRLVAVTYRRVAERLVREQELLDDPVQSSRWRETVAWHVAEFEVTPLDADAVSGVATPVPPRVRVRLDAGGRSIEQELWLK